VELNQFADQVFGVAEAIRKEFSERPFPEGIRVPKDWPSLRATVRNLAADLILCADVDEAIAQLRQDQSGALAAVWLTSQVQEQDSGLAIERAYAATAHEPTVLPLHAFCSYLIELCDGLELGSSKA